MNTPDRSNVRFLRREHLSLLASFFENVVASSPSQQVIPDHSTRGERRRASVRPVTDPQTEDVIKENVRIRQFCPETLIR